MKSRTNRLNHYRIARVINCLLLFALMTSCSSPTSGGGGNNDNDTMVSAPVFNPPGGSYSNGQLVTISCSTSDSSIYYTLDGSDPDEAAGILYESPVAVPLGTTLKARAFKAGLTESDATSATYTYSLPDGSYTLTSGAVETKDPSYVNILFQVQKEIVTGEIPTAMDRLTLADFTFREDGSDITVESCPRISHVTDQIPYRIYTVLMLDNSGSVGSNLDDIKSAAKSLVENKIQGKQYIAIYTFSDTPVLVQDFTANETTLNTAIDSISLGYNSTDLYNAVSTACSRWTESFTTEQIETGSVVLLTDGQDTTHTQTLSDALAARGSKKVIAIGVGDADSSVLSQLGNGGWRYMESYEDLLDYFEDTQQAIINWSDSFYWAYYLSPTRGSGTHNLEISLIGNQNYSSNAIIEESFTSTNFYSVMPGIYVNDDSSDKEGIDELAMYSGNSNETEIIIHSYFGLSNPEYEYIFNIGSTIATNSIIYTSSVEEMIKISINQKLPEDSTLVINDIANSFTKSINLVNLPDAPNITKITGGYGEATLQWEDVPEAETYNIYYQQGETVTTLTGSVAKGVESPYTITDLSNYQEHTFIVTAENDNGESPASSSCSITIPLGTKWTEQQLPDRCNRGSIAYGNGMFVVISSESNIAFRSSDGINWSSHSLPETELWISIAYGNGLFVAIARNSSIAAVSSDGITWTKRTLPAAYNWSSITYGNGNFVAIQDGNRNVALSSDGITWTTETLPLSARWNSITYGDGVFMAVAIDYDRAIISSDGKSWSTRRLPNLPSTEYWNCVYYGNESFVALTRNGSTAAISFDNGSTWSPSRLPQVNNWNSISYGGGVYIALCGSTGIPTSPNGITWTEIYPCPSWLGSIVYGNGIFVATKNNSTQIYTSP